MSAPLDIRFFVPGDAIPKGSMSGFPRDAGPCPKCKGAGCRGSRSCFGGRRVAVAVHDDGDKALEAWQGMVRVHAVSARNAAGARMIERPHAVEVSMVFLRDRPGAHTTTRGALSAEGMRMPLPTVKPDLDKLQRAVGDGLTQATARGLLGAIAEDDAQICVAQTAKIYAPAGAKPGVIIRARAISTEPAWALAELAALDPRIGAPARQGSLL